MSRHNVEQAERWDPWRPSVLLQGGPVRVVNDEPADDIERRPVGFSPPASRPVRAEREPLLWDGDQA